MKKIYSIITLCFLCSSIKAQNGTTCTAAVTIIPSTTCNYSTYTTSATEMWAQFVATSPTVNISLITAKFGLNSTHIHNLALIGGTCSNQTIIAEDELPFVFDADKLAIDLDASGLIVGNTYYLRAKREATIGTCDKGNCKVGGSTAPSTYQLCVQNITVIIPADFGLEAPNSAYGYLTNRGQLLDVNNNLVPDVKLYTLHANPAIYIANDKVSYVFSHTDSISDTLERIDMTLVGANTSTKTFKTEIAPGKTNFFLTHASDGVLNNSNYYRTVSNEVYPFIDMQWYSNNKGEKIYFIVRSGGDADNIVMKFDGATSVTALANGGLKVITPLGNIEYEAPHAYQINPAGNVVPMPWQANFLQVTSNSVKFDIRSYPTNMPLFIQVDKGHHIQGPPPTDNIKWSTYFGGSNADQINDIKSDVNNNLFIVGETFSTNFPQAVGVTVAFQSNLAGSLDGFVAKFLPSGELKWSTYIGGTFDDMLNGFDIAPNGDLYCVGNTNSNIIMKTKIGAYNNATFVGPWDNISGWLYDGFIFQLTQNGDISPWRTYYTGNSNESFNRCKFDTNGNFFVIGTTSSSNAPIVYSGTQYHHAWANVSLNPPNVTRVYDGYIVRFDQNSARTWATCIGASLGSSTNIEDDELFNLDFDASGDLYVVGRSSGTNYPNISTGIVSTPNASTNSGQVGTKQNGVITRFTNDGTIKWSSYIGSSGLTNARGVCIKNGNVYFTGTTSFSDFPYLNSGQYYLDYTGFNGSYDAYFVVYNNLNQRTHSTVIGGSDIDEGWDIKTDANNNIYIVGKTTSSNFPTPTNGNPANSYNLGLTGGQDYFVCAVREGNTDLLWSTLVGGSGYESQGLGRWVSIAPDGNNNLHLAGQTGSSASFPLNDGGGSPVYYQSSLNSWTDGTITRFDLQPIYLAGINENGSIGNGITVYPNPASSTITLNIDELKKNQTYKIYNNLGQILVNDKLINKKTIIDLESLSSGIYFLEVRDTKTNSSVKFIKND